MANEIETPKGFNEMNLNPESVDWTKTAVIRGTVVMLEALPAKRGLVPTAVVSTNDGIVRVWESAGLRLLFKELQIGDEVWIAVAGEQQLEGTKTMRLFRAARRAGEAPF